MGWHSAWGWWMPDDDKKKAPEPAEPKPKSYDPGLISSYMRDFLLELARKHNPTSATAGVKKAAVDLLETAQPTDMPPGRLRWSDLEKEVEKFGPQWTWADVFERMGRKK